MTAPIPKGYKRTKAGVIPEEWQVQRVGDIALIDPEILPAITPPDYEFNYIEIENVETGALKRFSRQIFQSAPSRARKVIRANDILLSSVRPHLKSHLLFTEQRGEWVCSTGFTVIRVFPEVVVSHYVFSHFMYDLVNRQIALLIAGSNYPAISRNDVQKLFIPLPPLPEQRAIAAALGDVDSLLAALDRLIAKKRAVQAAAMRDLLTGRVRLPGFEGEWEMQPYSDLLTFERPEKYIVKSTEYQMSGTPVLTANKSFILGYTDEEFGIFNELPVIIFDDFTTDSKFVNFPFKVKSSAIKILKSKSENVNLRFIFERMQITPVSLGDHKRYYISEYQNILIPVPSFPEQTAIAAALSDLDAELAALERERAKWQSIKQGMMDDLLTGRVRLV